MKEQASMYAVSQPNPAPAASTLPHYINESWVSPVKELQEKLDAQMLETKEALAAIKQLHVQEEARRLEHLGVDSLKQDIASMRATITDLMAEIAASKREAENLKKLELLRTTEPLTVKMETLVADKKTLEEALVEHNATLTKLREENRAQLSDTAKKGKEESDALRDQLAEARAEAKAYKQGQHQARQALAQAEKAARLEAKKNVIPPKQPTPAQAKEDKRRARNKAIMDAGRAALAQKAAAEATPPAAVAPAPLH